MACFTWPIANSIITRGFAYLSSIYVGGMHAALDLIPRGRPATGEPIRVVADGLVAGVGWDFYSGFFVAVDHADGWQSFYRHLYGQTPVAVGQRVRQGQIIGNMGNTGYSLGAHLHFDFWNTAKHDPTAFAKRGLWAHDPELYLGQEDDVCTEAEFNKRWDARWAYRVADVPDGTAEPTGHLNRYLRGRYPKLQLNVARAAAKGGALTALQEKVADLTSSFNKRWLQNWAKYVADVPDGVSEPTGHINRYLRGNYPKLQLNVARAVIKGGEVIKAIDNAVRTHAAKPHGGSGVTEARSRAIAQEEDDRLVVTK